MAIYQLQTGTYETRAVFALQGGSFRDKRRFAATAMNMASRPQPTRNELVVVTGGTATGIGAATVRELAARGLHVQAGVRRDAAALSAERIEANLKPHHTKINTRPMVRTAR